MPSIDEFRARYAQYSVDELRELRAEQADLTADAQRALEEEWERRQLPPDVQSRRARVTYAPPTARQYLEGLADGLPNALKAAALTVALLAFWAFVTSEPEITISPALIVGLSFAAILFGLWLWRERPSQQLSRLLGVAPESRDRQWKDTFCRLIPRVRLSRGDPERFIGGDGFRYVSLFFPPQPSMGSTTTIAKVRDRAIEEGCGIAINPRGNDADWMFACGALLQWRVFGDFHSPAGLTEGLHQRTVTEPETISVAAPDEEWLPLPTRAHLRSLLQSAGVHSPRVLWAYNRNDRPPHTILFDFGSTSLSDQAASDVLRRVAWYLPSLYRPGRLSLALQDEAWVPL